MLQNGRKKSTKKLIAYFKTIMSRFTLKRHLNVRIFVLENKLKVTFFTKKL